MIVKVPRNSFGSTLALTTNWLSENVEDCDEYGLEGKTGLWKYKRLDTWNITRGFIAFEIKDDTQAVLFKLRFG